MVQAPQRPALSAPTLIRLIARVADADVSEPRQSLSDRLSQWLGWTDAIALSTVLSGNPPAVAAVAHASVGDAESLCARVRVSLRNAITGDSASAADRRGTRAHAPARQAPMDTADDYPVFRQHYLSVQQTMETEIGNLRGRLRVMLAARAPRMARLATVDAVMERVLGARERSLLAGVPALLGAHFARLRDAERQRLADADAPEGAPVTPGAWLNVFRKDMQSVLLAELDVRFQTIEGLLAAIRTS
ncbi:Protein of unknown function DUF3348 [Burkholderia sp. lig30]|jgi:hypothetical protein|nr:Protein of unknown function DUF3348 [Burkholderia sp. lig30]